MRPQQLSLFSASPADAPQRRARDGSAKPQGSPRSSVEGQRQPEAKRTSSRGAVVPWTPERPAVQPLAERLSSMLNERVEVELTDNAWTMVSWKRRQGVLRFRLHHMFQSAHEGIVRAIAGFTGRARRAAGRTIDEYIRQNRHLIRQREERQEPELQTRGDVYDLREIFDRINAAHFANRVEARIGWGRRAPGRRRRSIKMGVYFHERKLIKIHPALDDARVPRHFVEMVVFHEMLHQAIPPQAGPDGRRTVHSPAFRAAERAFPEYERARAWEKANLGLLLKQRA